MERVTKEHLMADINVVLADAEELLRQAAQAGTEQAAELRQRAQTAIANAKTKLVDIEHRVIDGTKHAARVTDHWVHENPWKAVGVAAGIGVLIGLLINRR